MAQLPKRRPSIYDVAALAGVSHQTVSRVLNDHPSIREATRQKVLAAIAQTNYTPNHSARSLATNRTYRLGVLVDTPDHYGPNSTLRGFEAAARAAGFSVDAVTVSEGGDAEAAIDHLLGSGIEALCVVAPRLSSSDRIGAATRALPVVVVAAEPARGLSTVAVDQRAGTAMAVEHLIGLGHRDIRHVAGPRDWLDARARESAWNELLTLSGLPVREPVEGDWTADFGYHYASEAEDFGTAIFAANDQMALGILHGFQARGLRVPDDVSVVGFDDIPESRHFLPPLTTVRQDFHALGSLSVDLLTAALTGEAPQASRSIAPALVVRDSTAPPRHPR